MNQTPSFAGRISEQETSFQSAIENKRTLEVILKNLKTITEEIHDAIQSRIDYRANTEDLEAHLKTIHLLTAQVNEKIQGLSETNPFLRLFSSFFRPVLA